MFFTSRKYIHLNGGTEPQLQAAGQKNVACLYHGVLKQLATAFPEQDFFETSRIMDKTIRLAGACTFIFKAFFQRHRYAAPTQSFTAPLWC
jgi:hypothetical protein